MKKKESGFSLFELMVVIAIIGILSSIAIPNMISWRQNAAIRGAAFNLKSDLELAKMRAIRSGANVAVAFSGNNYDVFMDTDGDYERDTTPSPGEALVASGGFDGGISAIANFGGNSQTAFNNRGLALRRGTVSLTLGSTIIVVDITRLGLIDIR